MTYEAPKVAFENAVAVDFTPAFQFAPRMPAHEDVADPVAGWATRNPARAFAFLYVSPRDCAAVDELIGL